MYIQYGRVYSSVIRKNILGTITPSDGGILFYRLFFDFSFFILFAFHRFILSRYDLVLLFAFLCYANGYCLNFINQQY